MQRWIPILALVVLIPFSAKAAPQDAFEDLAQAIVDGSLTEGEQELLSQLSPREIDEINVILAEITSDWEDEADGGVIDACENIQPVMLRGYSYVRPYTYWLKWEFGFPDLMLEYAYYPPDCSKNHPKAFYITDIDLYQRLGPCGIAVRYDAMEGCKRRVTAVMGYSKWYLLGASLTAYHTQLGFQR